MRILVVDDQELNRTMLQYMLELEGYQVFHAENGKHALETFEQTQPDIILLDVIMPVMDGFETAPILKTLSGDLHLPIIFITSLDDQDSMLQCLEVGGDDFLTKPFDKVLLSAKIKAHARTRELSQRLLEQRNTLKYHQNQTEREHAIVEHIFSNAFSNNQYLDEIVSHYLSPASMFNGDLFLTNRSPLGGTYVFLGDFTGHGLAAAVGALPTAQTFFSMTNEGQIVGDIAKTINTQLLNLLPDDMFCAATIIELSNSGKAVSIWSGGMPEIFVIDDTQGLKQKIMPQHMALGILEGSEFESTMVNCDVTPHDRLLVFTDGVTETMNHNDEMFGEQRLETFYQHNPKAELKDLIAHLDHFRGTTEQADDLSIAQLKCLAAEDDLPQDENEISQLPWGIQLKLLPDDIRTQDPIAQVIDMISAFSGMEKHRSTLFLLLAEMYNNSVDHGLLELDSNLKDAEDGFFEFYSQRQNALENLQDGFLKLEVTYLPTEKTVRLAITDSGRGFDTCLLNKMLNQKDQHGRGLTLIAELGDKLDYKNGGRTIEVDYLLSE
ncbi:fused response regulator/phosphatase [Catenovulum adriaticum]|uniref:Fused response regulator/phosphatase n=1 Tax=Catenovulum adriaticum TaxID=2984846 RepID=A0ABY7ALY5_9ALTE|nr:fused response regulator/phosphatase [Catenovulum sp. TS8]WAJ70567.1 fused response regulator/phosphatase [Catenovulum sp. TS8]